MKVLYISCFSLLSSKKYRISVAWWWSFNALMKLFCIDDTLIYLWYSSVFMIFLCVNFIMMMLLSVLIQKGIPRSFSYFPIRRPIRRKLLRSFHARLQVLYWNFYTKKWIFVLFLRKRRLKIKKFFLLFAFFNADRNILAAQQTVALFKVIKSTWNNGHIWTMNDSINIILHCSNHHKIAPLIEL